MKPEQELQRAIDSFDMQQIYADFLVLEFNKFSNKVKRLFNSELKTRQTNQLAQIEFVDTLLIHLKDKPIDQQAYVLLGGLEYAQQRWGQFPNEGALFELGLKQDDLIQVISENMSDIKLEKLLENPSLISQKGKADFQEYIKIHKESLSITSEN